MAKGTREVIARLLLGLLLLFLGAMQLFGLSFKDIGLVVTILEFAAGAFWLWTLLP